jgi:hypothetical protein
MLDIRVNIEAAGKPQNSPESESQPSSAEFPVLQQAYNTAFLMLC